jgi:FeS assembly SUF system regulator
MLKISQLSDYACVLLGHMSAHAHALPNTAWAERARLPASTTAKLLKLLGKAGLVSATRGATGGYALAKPALQITLADVVQAIDGPLALTHCSGEQGCARSGFCSTRTHWQVINQAVLSALQAVSLDQLRFPLRPARSERPARNVRNASHVAPTKEI